MKIVIVIIFSLLPVLIYSQEDIGFEPSRDLSPKRSVWLNGGLGIYEAKGDWGFSLNLTLKIQKNNPFKFRYVLNEEFTLFEKPELFQDFGFLLGKSSASQYAKISAYGGIGVMACKERGQLIGLPKDGLFSSAEYEWENKLAIGIPLEIEFRLLPKHFFGAGISAYANLNFKKSLVGVLFKLEFGK
jgi:hypothetical protein